MIRKFRLFRFCLSQLLNVKVFSHLSFQNKIKQVCSDIPVPFPPPVSGTPHFFFQLEKHMKNMKKHLSSFMAKELYYPRFPHEPVQSCSMGLYEWHHPTKKQNHFLSLNGIILLFQYHESSKSIKKSLYSWHHPPFFNIIFYQKVMVASHDFPSFPMAFGLSSPRSWLVGHLGFPSSAAAAARALRRPGAPPSWAPVPALGELVGRSDVCAPALQITL